MESIIHQGLLAEINARLLEINQKLDAMQAPSISDEYLTVDQVAVKLNLSPSTVYRKIYAGAIPASKIGKKLLISSTVLYSVINKNKI